MRLAVPVLVESAAMMGLDCLVGLGLVALHIVVHMSLSHCHAEQSLAPHRASTHVAGAGDGLTSRSDIALV